MGTGSRDEYEEQTRCQDGSSAANVRFTYTCGLAAVPQVSPGPRREALVKPLNENKELGGDTRMATVCAARLCAVSQLELNETSGLSIAAAAPLVVVPNLKNMRSATC